MGVSLPSHIPASLFDLHLFGSPVAWPALHRYPPSFLFHWLQSPSFFPSRCATSNGCLWKVAHHVARVPLQSSLALHLGLVTFLLVETKTADGSDLNEDGLISAPSSRRYGPQSRRKYGSVPWLPRMWLDLHESQLTSKQRAWAWNGYRRPEMGDTIALKTSPPVNYFLQPEATLQRLRSLFW